MKPVSRPMPRCSTVCDVAAGARVLLEQLHVVRAREKVGRSQACHSGSDYGDSHLRTAIRTLSNIGCRETFARSTSLHLAATDGDRRAAPPTRRHRPLRHEPDQPGRHARRGGPTAARDPPRDGPALGNRVPLDRRRRPDRGLHGLRLRDDDRLPPLLLAPELPGPRAGQSRPGDPRLYDRSGPADAVGDRPSQAPRLLGQGRRSALAARGTSRDALGRVHGFRPRARRLDVLEPRHGAGT